MSTGTRHRARELALQALFSLDMVPSDTDETLDHFTGIFHPQKKAIPFFHELVRGVMRHRPEIDALLERFSSHWKLHRMSCVDRNILRIAVYEMLHCPEVPWKVSINEAVELGKNYGTEESGAFVNGILDSIRMNLERSREKEADSNNTGQGGDQDG